MYGTRGSIPIFNESSLKYGGNTTCLRIFNKHIPSHVALTIDAGSGYLSMGHDIITKEPDIREIVTLFTHWHHDHILGLFHSPVLFIKKYKMRMFGPLDSGIGPKQMMENMMKPPYFPINIKEVRGHFKYHNIEFPGREVILFHKQGIKVIKTEKYETELLSSSPHFKIKKVAYPIHEFLVVKTLRTYHPGFTISYRFEDMETGKIFVLLTDHENQDAIPLTLEKHVSNADVMVVDCQYSREKYDKQSVGYGHATPDYVVNLAQKGNVKAIGLTHHDPTSRDEDIDSILQEAKNLISGSGLKVFSCSDLMDINV